MPLTTRGSAFARRSRRDPYIHRAKKRIAVVVIVSPYRSAASRRSTSERANSATTWVGNGTNAISINRRMLSRSIGLSTRAKLSKSRWWFTHMIPIVRKLTA